MAEAATLDPSAFAALLSPLLSVDPFQFTERVEIPEERGRAQLDKTVRRELSRLTAVLDQESERHSKSSNYAEQLVVVRASAPIVAQPAEMWTDVIDELAVRERNIARAAKRARRPMERLHALIARFAPQWKAENRWPVDGIRSAGG